MLNGNDSPKFPVLVASSQDTVIDRLLDRQPLRVESLLRTAQHQGQPPDLETAAWTSDHVPGPNVSDKQTVLNLAVMASDAYVPDSDDPAWLNLTGEFNRSQNFGFQSNSIRGHIFADQGNSTIVVAIKGTERGELPPGYPRMKRKAYSGQLFLRVQGLPRTTRSTTIFSSAVVVRNRGIGFGIRSVVVPLTHINAIKTA